jgi:regulator of sigma E protease
VHEFGHFLIARMNKIGVSVFSIGFGPRLFSFKDKKGTEWQFAIIPLGGFVKFFGDENAASIKIHAEEKSDNVGSAKFDEAPVLSRFFTVIAGPLANFIFSVLIFSLILIIQGVSVNDPVIGKINKFYEANYDLKINDKILEVEGKKVNSFEEIFFSYK